MEASIAKPPTRGTLGVGARQRMNTYANSKLIGGLWLAQLAKEHKEIYFASVSPGGCGTDVYQSAPQPFPFLMGLKPVVAMFEAIGAAHPVAVAARRCMTALTDKAFPQKFLSGAVVGGPYIQISKSTELLVNQGAFSSYYEDAELMAEAARVVRAAVER
jgi:hypothetical protein